MQLPIEITKGALLGRRSAALVLILLTAAAFACKSSVDEVRPGIFDRPYKSELHGRIVEQHYRYYNGPRTIHYSMFEIDGSQLRIPGGAVERTAYCEVDGIEAVAFTARGSHPAIYILQLNGDERIFERLCDYGSLGRWHGAVFMGCDPGWDAEKRERVRIRWDPEKEENVVY